ncbi:MAG: response regulator [Nitrospirota bacterium]
MCSIGGYLSRILVIDDELSMRHLLRSILEHAGHTVFDASDGRTGIALWRREPLDVVVTDIFMPGKDGVEVITELNKAVAKPKIIAMSGVGKRTRSTGSLPPSYWGRTGCS